MKNQVKVFLQAIAELCYLGISECCAICGKEVFQGMFCREHADQGHEEAVEQAILDCSNRMKKSVFLELLEMIYTKALQDWRFLVVTDEAFGRLVFGNEDYNKACHRYGQAFANAIFECFAKSLGELMEARKNNRQNIVLRDVAKLVRKVVDDFFPTGDIDPITVIRRAPVYRGKKIPTQTVNFIVGLIQQARKSAEFERWQTEATDDLAIDFQIAMEYGTWIDREKYLFENCLVPEEIVLAAFELAKKKVWESAQRRRLKLAREYVNQVYPYGYINLKKFSQAFTYQGEKLSVGILRKACWLEIETRKLIQAEAEAEKEMKNTHPVAPRSINNTIKIVRKHDNPRKSTKPRVNTCNYFQFFGQAVGQ